MNMKMTPIVWITLFIWSTIIMASDQESQKAQHYLNDLGEVFFSFNMNSSEAAALKKRLQSNPLSMNGRSYTTISDFISIEQVNGETVYAYATKEQWDLFYALGYNFTVEKHPGEYNRFQMSDYEDLSKEDWTKFPSYQGFLNIMEGLQSKYPNFFKVEEIGQSVKGKKLLVAKVSSNVNKETGKPKVYFTSTVHGNEIFGMIHTLQLAEEIMSGYGTDSRATKYLDSLEFWISPLLNPDGCYWRGDNTVQGGRRTNANNKDLNRDYPCFTNSGTFEQQVARAQVETKAYIAFEQKHDFITSIDFHGGIDCIIYPWSAVKPSQQKPVDIEWFKYICTEYADLAHENSPGSYFTYGGDGVINGPEELYEAKGTRPDYQFYYRRCRSVTVELNKAHNYPDNMIATYWEYNRESYYAFLDQTLNGLQGTVVDRQDNKPLRAKVFVENHDKEYSFVYSNDINGRYCRPIFAGNYKVTYSADGYEPQTIDVTVKNDQPTYQMVKLKKIGSALNNVSSHVKSIKTYHTGNILHVSTGALPLQQVSLFATSGKLITQIGTVGAKNIMIDTKNIAQGNYLLKLTSSSGSMSKVLYLKK